MSNLLEKYDYLLEDCGPAAITLKQWLKPVGSQVIFPPTYANPSQTKGDPPVYNIDRFGETVQLGKRFNKYEKTHTFMDDTRIEQGREYSVCVIDSIQSQANRIEPMFNRLTDESGISIKLVPDVIIKVKIDNEVQNINLLDVGHRAADALVLFSSLHDKITKAIKARKQGDSEPLAKISPTSLVFGMWDSRMSGVKVPRLINSIIRAYDVLEHRRSSQFNAAVDFEAAGIVPAKGEKKLSEVGMDDAPATFQHGGIEARSGICRESSLNLCTLRDIINLDDKNNVNKENTKKLQRYILGLALTAITYFDGKALNLRQGCQLVTMPDKPMERNLMKADGQEESFEIDCDIALSYAKETADAFDVGQDLLDETFDLKLAKAALKKSKKDEEK